MVISAIGEAVARVDGEQPGCGRDPHDWPYAVEPGSQEQRRLWHELHVHARDLRIE
jgi:hypothetical protein